jgi:hypothetical protein
LEYKIEIPDEIAARLGTWQKCAGVKLIINGDRVDVHIATDNAAVEAAIRSERTPKVATQPTDFGNIRWR